MNEKLYKLVSFIVGAICLVLAFQFWMGSDIFSGWFAKSVEEGKVAAPVANAWSGILEVLISIVSGLGGFLIIWAFKGIAFLTGLANDGIEGFKEKTPEVETPVGTIPEQMYGDLTRLLIQSALDGDKRMTTVVAEKLAGKPYLTETNVQVFPKA